MTNSEHWKLHHACGSIDYDKIAKNTKEAMKEVDYDTLAYWKGKKQSDKQKMKKVNKILARRDAYNKYKSNGGTLKWNDFQREVYGK